MQEKPKQVMLGLHRAGAAQGRSCGRLGRGCPEPAELPVQVALERRCRKLKHGVLVVPKFWYIFVLEWSPQTLPPNLEEVSYGTPAF